MENAKTNNDSINWTKIVKEGVQKLDGEQIASILGSIFSSYSELKKLKEQYKDKEKEREHSRDLQKNQFDNNIRELEIKQKREIDEIKEKGKIFLEAVKVHKDTRRDYFENQTEVIKNIIDFAKIYIEDENTPNKDKKEVLMVFINQGANVIKELSEHSQTALKELPKYSGGNDAI